MRDGNVLRLKYGENQKLTEIGFHYKMIGQFRAISIRNSSRLEIAMVHMKIGVINARNGLFLSMRHNSGENQFCIKWVNQMGEREAKKQSRHTLNSKISCTIYSNTVGSCFSVFWLRIDRMCLNVVPFYHHHRLYLPCAYFPKRKERFGNCSYAEMMLGKYSVHLGCCMFIK